MINDLTRTFHFPTYFQQLKYLFIDNVGNVNIDQLGSFLFLTPSLDYLKLVGGKQMLDGKRWEQFIQINLSQLEIFEIYFEDWNLSIDTQEDFDQIISAFQTPFWTD